MSDEIPGSVSETQALTVPVHADGTIAQLPEALQKHLDSIVSKRLREDRERRAAKPDPVEHEKLTTLELQLEQYRIRDAEAQKQYAEALGIREKREQAEREKYQQEIDRRTARIQRSLRADIQTAALKAGARDESLDELAALLSGFVTLNDDLDPVVMGADGQPDATGIEGLVTRYLDSKPHHKRGTSGQSMAAAGGSFRAQGTVTGGPNEKVAAIQARVARQGTATGRDMQELREARASAS
jgi:hypothetical protein